MDNLIVTGKIMLISMIGFLFPQLLQIQEPVSDAQMIIYFMEFIFFGLGITVFATQYLQSKRIFKEDEKDRAAKRKLIDTETHYWELKNNKIKEFHNKDLK